MSWSRCPECGAKDVPATEPATDTKPVEPVQFRLYDCPNAACGCYWHTAEKLIVVRPATRRLRHLYREETKGQPAGATP